MTESKRCVRTTALVCQSCGGHASVDGFQRGQQCAYCGAPSPQDRPVLARVHRHTSRLWRWEQKLRAVLRRLHHADLIPSHAGRHRWRLAIGVVSTLFIMFLLGLSGLALGVLSIAAERGSNAAGLLVVGGILLMLLAVFFPLAGLFVVGTLGRRQGKELLQALWRESQARVIDHVTTVAMRCPQCGAQSALGAAVDAPALPCPYCEAPVVPSAHDLGEAATLSVAELQARADVAHADAVERLTKGKRRYLDEGEVEGFSRRGGVFEASVAGVDVWLTADVTDRLIHQRLEVDADTALWGDVWFVRHPHAAAHAHVADSLDLPIPPRQSIGDAQLEGWVAVASADAELVRTVLSSTAVLELIRSLDEFEAVRFDGAGASCWSVLPIDALFSSSKNLSVFASSKLRPLLTALSSLGPAGIGRFRADPS